MMHYRRRLFGWGQHRDEEDSSMQLVCEDGFTSLTTRSTVMTATKHVPFNGSLDPLHAIEYSPPFRRSSTPTLDCTIVVVRHSDV